MSNDQYPEDRARQVMAQFQTQLNGAKMRDPHWKTQHPTAGNAGVEYVWRFGKSGVVARNKVGLVGWDVFPVDFLGTEINNYRQIADTQSGQSPEQIEVLLQSFDPPAVAEVVVPKEPDGGPKNSQDSAQSQDDTQDVKPAETSLQ